MYLNLERSSQSVDGLISDVFAVAVIAIIRVVCSIWCEIMTRTQGEDESHMAVSHEYVHPSDSTEFDQRPVFSKLAS